MAVKQVFNTSAELDYPTILPTLDLDFANSKTLDSRITFARSSGGSYVGADGFIKYAGVNEARFDHNPITGESLGLLVEEPRTNLMLRSEEFDNVSWGTLSATVSSNTQVAPNGTTSADTITDVNGATTANVGCIQSTTLADSTTYAMSCYIKAGTKTTCRVGIRDKAGVNIFANFNLAAVSTTAGNALSSTIQDAGNGWYRCTAICASATGATSPRGLVFMDTVSYTANGTGTIHVWGAQLEAGTFPTSYIPTQGSTGGRTRAADNASITGTNLINFFNFNEGTSFVSFKFGPTTALSRNFLLYLSGGSGVISQRTTNTGVEHALTFSPVLRDTISTGIPNTEIFTAPYITGNSCFAYKSGDIVYSTSGVIQYTNNLTFLPLNNPEKPVTALAISSGGSLNGTISRVRYFPKRLPNSQIRALTL